MLFLYGVLKGSIELFSIVKVTFANQTDMANIDFLIDRLLKKQKPSMSHAHNPWTQEGCNQIAPTISVACSVVRFIILSGNIFWIFTALFVRHDCMSTDVLVKEMLKKQKIQAFVFIPSSFKIEEKLRNKNIDRLFLAKYRFTIRLSLYLRYKLHIKRVKYTMCHG